MPLLIVPPRKVVDSPEGTGVVTSINGLDGALTLTNGSGLHLDVTGQDFTFSVDANYVSNQLSQGNGISLSGSNPILIRAKRAALLIFMDSGFTPSGIGADANVQVVPYSPTDGSVITYNLRHMFFRVEATTGGESRIYPEVYTGTGQFSGATNLFGGANYLNISGAGVYQHTTTTFTTTTVQSGNKIRIQVPVLDAGHTGWYVALLLEEQ